MDFQVNDQTYFVSLAEDERHWRVISLHADGRLVDTGLRGRRRVRSALHVARGEATNTKLD